MKQQYLFYFTKIIVFVLGGFFLAILSCEETEDTALNSIELITSESIGDPYLPDDYDLTEWNDYYEAHNEFPRVAGAVREYPVEVMVKDGEGNPVVDVTVNFSADGGEVTPVSSVTGADGKATASWTFDGSWESWGNYVLTITALDADGETHLDGSPILVECTIEAPPGV